MPDVLSISFQEGYWRKLRRWPSFENYGTAFHNERTFSPLRLFQLLIILYLLDSSDTYQNHKLPLTRENNHHI